MSLAVRAFVLGVALSGALAAGLTAWLMSGRLPHGAVAVAAFSVDGGTVQVRPDAVPLRFETAPAERSAPLPRTPVTARVATLEARTAPSFAPLDGRVVEVKARLGEQVKQGARLVLVRSGELAGMKRELRAAQLAIGTKQAMVDRLQLLVDSRAAPQNDLLVAESELKEARLTAQAADAKLRSLAVGDETDNGYWVLATRTGTVVQLDASPGKQVGPDKDHPVATVADLDEVLVLADVAQRDAASLAVNLPVAVRSPGGGAPITGHIEVVSDVVDTERQTVPVRVRVKNPGHALRAHAFVEATFLSDEPGAVVQVPAQAVVSDGAASVVFVETAPGVFARRAVQTGHQTRERVEVREGLAAGERVVVRGALLLLNALSAKR
jgi:membrane fusion protein, heavy metal efflux system